MMQTGHGFYPDEGRMKKWGLRSLTDRHLKEITKPSQKEGAGEIDEGEFILCGNCRNVITSTVNKIEMNGKHTHTFTNPKGFVYRVGCFGEAPGILNQGAPTLEFTWFAGFAWSYSLCIRCFAHLGWFYRSGEKTFYGLILDHLIEEKRFPGTGGQ